VFGISGTELLVIGLFAFIIFGPDKLPEIIRTVNKAVAMFKRTQEDMERTIKAEMYGLDPDKDNSIFKPLESALTGEPKPKKASTASSLYGTADVEEEDEE
jgi:TatA/E family protein of Tat protein translocase